nr:CRISPR-associated protein Cas5 [Thermus brevis]
MGVLRFVLAGKRAHFRRYYTNSSALSYPVPPPASLLGLLGAALGLGPEYGEVLRGLFLSARPLGRHRALMQTVSYLMMKSGGFNKELRGLHPDGRTQVPIQLLVGEGGGTLRYEVWVASEDRALLTRLRAALEDPHYPLALGPAFALAWVEEVEQKEGTLQVSWHGEGVGWWKVACLVRWEAPGAKLYRDRFPILLSGDRSPLKVEELVLELEGRPMDIEYRGLVLVVDGVGIGGLFPALEQDEACM